MIGLFIYIVIGVALCAIKDEPDHEDQESETFYMFFLIALVFLWPLYLLWKFVKRNG
ncbi:hypothetical protein [Halobacillus seohaensis]|uniref:Uncharacterized protein n=1 Tax=Halobacillus seohaensis TaxID=447421 RepID=A0ABW2EK51_9BACI